VRLGDDEARGVQDPADGRGRRDGQALALEVPGDRGGTGVEAPGRESRPQRHDPVAHQARRLLGAGAWPARPGPEGVEPLLPVPAQKPVQVAAADTALRGRGGDGQLS
jgi:hypothetical protein